MPRHKVLSEEEEFEAYYASADSPTQRSTRDIAHDTLRDRVSYATVAITVEAIRNHLVAKDEVAARYLAWKEGRKERRSIYEKRPDGKLVSLFPSVQAFINRGNSTGLKTLQDALRSADKIYHFLDYKDPARWNADDMHRYLGNGIPDSMKSAVLIDARRVAPQLADYGSEEGRGAPRPGDFKVVNIKRYDLLTAEINRALDHLDETGFYEPCTVIRTHIALGCREGSVKHEGEDPGLLHLPWSNVNLQKMTADVFEGKVKKGILWKDCPLDLFGWNVPARIKELKGRVVEFSIGDKTHRIDSRGYVFGMPYDSLRAVYDLFEKTLHAVNPDATFSEVTPHTGRHLHVNLLWERDVPMELIAGDAEAGQGVFGVGWTDLSTLKKFYFTLSMRSPKVQAARKAAAQKSPALAHRIMAEYSGNRGAE